MSQIQDDKAQYVVPFILDCLESHRQKFADSASPPPFFIGLNGVQGAGKTVLVSILKTTLESRNLPTVVFSIDDCYLTHADQIQLAASNPTNPLLQHRGQPSTHDVPLARSVFSSLSANKPTMIPQYNKAAFSGYGDRVEQSKWETVNKDPARPVKVVLFEGWCVGFRPLSEEVLQKKWQDARHEYQSSGAQYKGRLAHNSLESVQTVNSALREYDQLTDQLDALIHIDAYNATYVYKWRLEQEAGLRSKSGGQGMTDDQVKEFVDGYYPSYELFSDNLRQGVFIGHGNEWELQGRQLRLIVGEDRKVIDVIRT